MEPKVFRTRQESPSLRGMVPQAAVESLKLKPGDTIKWALESRDGELIAVVKKAWPLEDEVRC